MKERLESQVVSFHDPINMIKMNKIPLPSGLNRHKQHTIKCVDKTTDDLKLMGQIRIALQVREGNFFEVENADAPPSLSKHGVLRTGQKSDLVQCLEVDFPSDFAGADIKLIDGANYFVRPDTGIHTFNDYAQSKILPYIVNQLSTVKYVDMIWDQHLRVRNRSVIPITK